jgi:hypothetical protein
MPNFPLARAEQEARNIVGGYTHAEHKAYIASLPNNDRCNLMLKVAGVGYGPRPVPISTEVPKKRCNTRFLQIIKFWSN